MVLAKTVISVSVLKPLSTLLQAEVTELCNILCTDMKAYREVFVLVIIIILSVCQCGNSALEC